MFGGRNYSPTELLDVCKVKSKFPREHFVGKILAEICIADDSNDVLQNLEKILGELGRISIGEALNELWNVSNIGNELQGGLDGIDALTYHLSGSQCEKGIAALQKVLERFNEEKE